MAAVASVTLEVDVPAAADAFYAAALDGEATTLKPAKKGFRGHGGVSPGGTGSHRVVVGGVAGPYSDPDGFEWESR